MKSLYNALLSIVLTVVSSLHGHVSLRPCARANSFCEEESETAK